MVSYVIDYQIEMAFMVGRGKVIPITINSLTKTCDYYKNFFPIYEGNVVILNKNLDFIRNNQTKIYVHLKITARYHTHSSSPVIGEQIVLDQVFIPFFEQSSFSDVVSPEDMEYDKAPSIMTSSTRQVKFTMYSAKGIMANKVPVNAILSDESGADVGTAILYILNQAKSSDDTLLFDQVIVDKISQDQKFFELVIPPNNIAMSLRELQVRYGIFNGGLLAFYDEPILYLLNKYTSDHDYTEEQHKNIFFNYYEKPMGMSKIESDTDSIRYHVYGFPKKAEITVYEAELLGNVSSYSNFAMAHNAIHFEDGDCTVFNDPVVSVRGVNEKHVKTGDKYNIEYDELNNPLMMTSYLKAIGPHRIYALPNMQMVDYSSFRPNANLVLEFEYSQMRDMLEKGTFSFLTATLHFQRVNIGNNIFTCNASDLIVLQS